MLEAFIYLLEIRKQSDRHTEGASNCNKVIN